MRAPRQTNSNWLETWNRRSRLRSGTRLLVPEDPSDVSSVRSKRTGVLNSGGESGSFGSETMEASDQTYRESVNSSKDANTDADVDCKPSLELLGVANKVQESKTSASSSIEKGQIGRMEVDADTEHKPVIEKCVNVDADADLEYKQFLERVIIERMTYSVQIDFNGSPFILKYAKEFSDDVFPGGQKKTGNSLVDKEYQIMLTYLREDDDLMVLEIDGNVIRYEMESEDEEDVEVLQSENECISERSGLSYRTELQRYTGSSQSSDASLCLQPTCTGSTHHCGHAREDDGSAGALCKILPFKDRLNNLLERPFDQNEYDDLLNKATARLPLKKYKHLRGQSVPYLTKALCSSFLDHYPGLANQIKSADSIMGLNLLRGFFFWLQNVSHEGAFQPWESASPRLLTDGSESDPGLPIQIE